MAVGAAVAVIGIGMQAYGQYKEGQAQAAAARQSADMKKAQSREMLEKMKIQSERMNTQGEEFKGQQLTDYASRGVALGTGATLVALEDTNMKISMGIEDMKRDSLFKINQINQGVAITLSEGRDAANAGAIRSGSTLLQGAGDYYKNT